MKKVKLINVAFISLIIATAVFFGCNKPEDQKPQIE